MHSGMDGDGVCGGNVRGESEGRESVCVCRCKKECEERESMCVWTREGIQGDASAMRDIAMQSVTGPHAPTAQLQVIMGITLEARGSRGTNAKLGKTSSFIQCLAKAGRVGIYLRQVCYVGGSDLKQNRIRNVRWV